ncbi:hypothetical protein DM02DRAFT_19352 [Periconia macrospinosa]|uniref:Uncharacterized protein n=1 Tax=Periconia macrospinosa TaxID=97972 RepID=A0A2V1DMI4_9PLEO|nr:hypothetical protein DM02DRAFT_19352 [Periconia macrospinosa]
MASDLVRTIIIHFFKMFSAKTADEVTNGKHDLMHLVIANFGYRIQSQILHIPDRFGLFSPGPTCLQIWEGATVAILFTKLAVALAIVVPLLAFRRQLRNPGYGRDCFIAVTALKCCVYLWWAWYFTCEERKPGYKWHGCKYEYLSRE